MCVFSSPIAHYPFPFYIQPVFRFLIPNTFGDLVGANGEQAAQRAAQGFDMISVATDVDIISRGFEANVQVASGLRGVGGSGGAYNLS